MPTYTYNLNFSCTPIFNRGYYSSFIHVWRSCASIYNIYSKVYRRRRHYAACELRDGIRVYSVVQNLWAHTHTRLIDVAHCSLFQSRTRTINCPRRTTSYTLVCAATAATVCWARKKIILSYMYRTPPLRIVVGKNIHSSLHFRRIKHILMVATSMYFIRCAASLFIYYYMHVFLPWTTS